jgi:glycosyltransferase involved in cell wall biosynthesis
MRFSIVMASFLGKYKRSAMHRDKKIVRAIQSVLDQTLSDWELIVISDGCELTSEIVTPFVYENLPKVRLLQIPKQPMWSGAVRNAGIFKAEGEIICYLDVDDFFGQQHLEILARNISSYDWILFNDWNFDRKSGHWYENKMTVEVGRCGTSNIAHRRAMNAYWSSNSYLHDWVMIKTLMGLSKNYTQSEAGQYYVGHVPNRYDV